MTTPLAIVPHSLRKGMQPRPTTRTSIVTASKLELFGRRIHEASMYSSMLVMAYTNDLLLYMSQSNLRLSIMVIPRCYKVGSPDSH
jgi:hypothetical protein